MLIARSTAFMWAEQLTSDNALDLSNLPLSPSRRVVSLVK